MALTATDHAMNELVAQFIVALSHGWLFHYKHRCGAWRVPQPMKATGLLVGQSSHITATIRIKEIPMSEEETKLSGPDLTQGVELSTIPDGVMLLGHAQGEPVLLARRGDEIFAIGAICTHYGAPLEQGLFDGDTIRCQWHHACFSLRTGEALRAPALDPVSRWRVEQVSDDARQFTRGETRVGAVYVRKKLKSANRTSKPLAAAVPETIVIVGGGAAGNAAAEMLRRESYSGRITMLSADASVPCDRPNLSKGYLSGAATDESNLLRSAKFYSAKFYKDHKIDLYLGAHVARIDTAGRRVEIADGSRHAYDALLLVTGAEPVRLDVPGAALPHVHYLRTLADGRALVASALAAKRAVVIGASFIGLEVAASLRARDIEVHVVGTETILMEKVLGPEVGNFLRKLHEDHGATFHLGTTATTIDKQSVTLKNGKNLQADLVVVGIGVWPAISLAEQTGLAIDRGVIVDEYLETNVPGIFAAGDIARWPDRLTGERIRVEHWVVAERQGQTAARNMLGRREPFDCVPFFWTEQYDFGLGYVGHAERWDKAEIEGSLEARDCAVTYRLKGRKLAMAVVHRDLEGLRAEVEFERVIARNSSGAETAGGSGSAARTQTAIGGS
jgi:NADPH-dependent 2,4-dienoyl-CoA reductase/sulfur reductase-like enzyme/nitrite reductase/ring-hydroxylating ferredoxin subunit